MPTTQVRSKQQLVITDNLSFGAAYRATNLLDPVSAQDAATKAYVDSVKQGLDIKDSVRAATTANITLSGAQTIDGVSVIAGDRVLVKNQTAGQDNGIYVASLTGWTRAADADISTEVNAGMFTFVEEGTANGDSGWVLTTNNPITLGTTPLTFTQFSGAGQVEAGNGLTKTGNTLNVGTASTGRIVVNADDIDLAVTGVTAGTYGNAGFNVPNLTIDAYGRTTAAANRDLFGTPAANLVFASPNGASGAPAFRGLVAADIPSLDASKITTGTLSVARGGTGVDGSAAANGTLLIGNGTGYTLATLTAAANRTAITNASGAITIDISSAYVGQASITTLGTITTGTWSAGTIAANRGGTGQTTYAVGDLLYADTTSTLAKLADVAVGSVLISGGINAIPSYGKVQLAAGASQHVTGILPVANGGTGLNSSAAANGQLLIGNGTGFALANITAGTGVSITNGAGTISIAVNTATFIAVANYVVRESPTGTINGTNPTFTLAATPLAGTEEVYVNGILQNSGGNDYTISGATITFVAGAIPQTNDVVRVTYLK